ncbi:DNA topoisomerase [Cytobacillus sp. S13-E01]|uniref:DNA topoisomerase n=1 Tax=Cytobacillus sp. S13-E01 TaxID=3031326 RepID=UPI0023D82764|nr:DNA topoisomerase [Cytobacillus sp. S13-E01]MDF0728734.1 DNA topoisomerase [Cytobacillus sp. S13-E01]
MGKSLIIAEKPNVAKQLLQSPRFRGVKFHKGTMPYYGFFENENYILTWGRGHVFEVLTPGEHNEELKVFRIDNLPIILPVKYKAIKDSKEQVDIIMKLINRNDVNKIINACDNDKEGELIFREIYEESKTNKPMYRIWLSNYEIGEVEAAFNRLLEGKDFDSLANSARARQYLDHLLGDTVTRASTVKLAQNKFLLSGGRVQLCLLNEIRKRELEVDNFIPKTFYNLYTDTGFLAEFIHEEEYITNPTFIKELAGKLKGEKLEVKEFIEKESKRNPYNLFNATDFLKACIHKLSLKAPQAKKILQKLYEEGFVSYPRSLSKKYYMDITECYTKVTN